MQYQIIFSEEKNLILKETRKVSFEDIIEAISSGKLLDNVGHPKQKKYPNQKILVVEIDKYVYAVPYIIDKKKKMIFLKTLFPSRKLTKRYIK